MKGSPGNLSAVISVEIQIRTEGKDVINMRDRMIARAGEIVQQRMDMGNRGFCTLALVDEDGYPAMTTVSIAKADGIKWLAFCTSLRANSVLRARRSCKAGVCVNSEGYHISLNGTIEVLADDEIKREMWHEGLRQFFSGPQDPDYCVLRFETERYNLLIDWHSVRGSFR